MKHIICPSISQPHAEHPPQYPRSSPVDHLGDLARLIWWHIPPIALADMISKVPESQCIPILSTTLLWVHGFPSSITRLTASRSAILRSNSHRCSMAFFSSAIAQSRLRSVFCSCTTASIYARLRSSTC